MKKLAADKPEQRNGSGRRNSSYAAEEEKAGEEKRYGKPVG